MKTQIAFGIIVLLGCYLSSASATAQATSMTATNEVRQVHFAEDVIMIEFIYGLSPSVRREREKCSLGCRGGQSALEIAIGSLGVNRSKAATTTLVNLLGLRLDAGGAEDRSCQILIRGPYLVRHLKQLQAKKVAALCRLNFSRLRNRELADVLDVTIEQVCRSEDEIHSARDELLKAIKANVMCEQ